MSTQFDFTTFKIQYGQIYSTEATLDDIIYS